MNLSNKQLVKGYIIGSSILIILLVAGMVFTTITLYQVKQNVAAADNDIIKTDSDVQGADSDAQAAKSSADTADSDVQDVCQAVTSIPGAGSC